MITMHSTVIPAVDIMPVGILAVVMMDLLLVAATRTLPAHTNNVLDTSDSTS